MFEGMFDPVPYAGEGLAVPNVEVPEGKAIYWNGDYDRLDEWVDWLIQKHREGHPVFLLIPWTDNAECRKLRRYGVLPFAPDQRIFPTIRNVEIIVLKGDA